MWMRSFSLWRCSNLSGPRATTAARPSRRDNPSPLNRPISPNYSVAYRPVLYFFPRSPTNGVRARRTIFSQNDYSKPLKLLLLKDKVVESFLRRQLPLLLFLLASATGTVYSAERIVISAPG